MIKKLFSKKSFWLIAIILVILVIRHIVNIENSFYVPDYPFKNVSVASDNEDIFRYTGLSPVAAEEMIKNGRESDFKLLNKMYFKKPEIKKQYILFPITAEEKLTGDFPPLAPIKKGDILVSFSTHTLDWRHGHIALALTDGADYLLEHISVGNKSVITRHKKWNEYGNFVVLRHPDEELSSKAVTYAVAKLGGVPYSIFAGIKKKDKSKLDSVDSSHCSHIVWQAYMAVGEDLDSNKGPIVTPMDIAMSEKLKVVQIYGLNPQKYQSRILLQ